MAILDVPQATPALIHCANTGSLRAANAAFQSLEILWQPRTRKAVPQLKSEWAAFRDEKKSSVQATPITLASLEPLIETELEFQDE